MQRRSSPTLLLLMLGAFAIASAQQREGEPASPPRSRLLVADLDGNGRGDTLFARRHLDGRYSDLVLRFASETGAQAIPIVRPGQGAGREDGWLSITATSLDDDPAVDLLLIPAGEERGRTMLLRGGAWIRERGIVMVPDDPSTDPEHLRPLRPGTEITRASGSTLRGLPCWELRGARRVTSPPQRHDSLATSDQILVRPTPGDGRISVDLRIGAGRHRWRISAPDGATVMSGVADIGEKGSGLLDLDLSRFASGRYLIAVDRDGLPPLSAPIIITR